MFYIYRFKCYLFNFYPIFSHQFLDLIENISVFFFILMFAYIINHHWQLSSVLRWHSLTVNSEQCIDCVLSIPTQIPWASHVIFAQLRFEAAIIRETFTRHYVWSYCNGIIHFHLTVLFLVICLFLCWCDRSQACVWMSERFSRSSWSTSFWMFCGEILSCTIIRVIMTSWWPSCGWWERRWPSQSWRNCPIIISGELTWPYVPPHLILIIMLCFASCSKREFSFT